ncbi:MAG: hypothetical protein GY820_21230 [Gammaproteobacteria bacterium]|nr:hypothetical protein [Gammaproteobacteria bacterium]
MKEVIEVDGQQYRKIDTNYAKKQIVILQRGWVVVGDVTREGDELTINKCSVIRVWGTTKGLGEIALAGPTPKTKLDPCPQVTVHILTTVARMDCNYDNWDK